MHLEGLTFWCVVHRYYLRMIVFKSIIKIVSRNIVKQTHCAHIDLLKNKQQYFSRKENIPIGPRLP